MPFRTITILTVLIAASITLLNSQERESSLQPTSVTTGQSPQTEQLNCKSPGKCFDAGSYTATASDIFEGETPYSHQVRLLLSFSNVNDKRHCLGIPSPFCFLAG